MAGIATTGSAIAIGFSFPIICGILVMLRFLTRFHQNVPRFVDDWLCLAAWFCLTGCCASILTGVFKNAFVDAPLSGPNDVTEQQHLLAQVTAALVILWMGANAFIKLAVLFFYRRIFIGKWFNICSWSLIGLSVVWFVYAVGSWLFYCGTSFKEDVEGGWLVCPRWGFEIQMGVFAMDSFIDFFLLLLPIPFVWRLHLELKKKIALCVVFLLGGFAFVAGLNNTIIQLVYLTNPSLVAGGANFFQGSSLLFSNWPAIEIGVGLIACNLPSLSFRAVHVLPQTMRRGFDISLSKIQHAAAVITLRSGSRHTSPTHSNRSPYQTVDPSKPGGSGDSDITGGPSKGIFGSGSLFGKGSMSGKSGVEEVQLEDLGKGRSGEEPRGFDAV